MFRTLYNLYIDYAHHFADAVEYTRRDLAASHPDINPFKEQKDWVLVTPQPVTAVTCGNTHGLVDGDFIGKFLHTNEHLLEMDAKVGHARLCVDSDWENVTEGTRGKTEWIAADLVTTFYSQWVGKNADGTDKQPITLRTIKISAGDGRCSFYTGATRRPQVAASRTQPPRSPRYGTPWLLTPGKRSLT